MAEIEKQMDFHGLGEAFIFSNTPNYLYKKFRQNESIVSVAKKFSTGQLIRAFQESTAADLKSAQAVLFNYSLIVALSFKPYSEVRDFFTGLPESGIEWAKEIASIFLSSAVATNFYNLELSTPTINAENFPI